MNFVAQQSRQSKISWAQEILELARDRQDSYAVTCIEQAISQYTEAHFSIAVLGKAKRGKSTLLNALLGRRDDLVAPIDRLPASSAISRFSWSEQSRAIIHFRDGRREETSFERVREFVTEESNPENQKGVEVVDIFGPFPGLDREVELVDTPGAGSIHEHHDALLHAFIPRADAVIFLVSARMPLDQDELDLLAKVKSSDVQKIFFAINRVDEVQASDLREAIRHNQSLLSQVGYATARIHPISAKLALLGNLEESGLKPFVSEIAQFIAANKGRVLDERLIARVRQAVDPLRMGLQVELASSKKNRQELEEDLRSLLDSKTSIESDRTLTEREFSLAWNRAIDEFERSLDDIKTSVTSQLVEKINAASLNAISRLRTQLPTIINDLLEEQLGPKARQMESELREATSKLQSKYPRIACEFTGNNTAPQVSSGIDLASVGGALTAAAGISLATAGSAAAASIAAANAAALAAATTTVAAPSVLSSLLTSVPYVGGMLSSLATGTATVSAPVAMSTTPLWVALSGPVGWSLAGIGVLAVPFAWRFSKLKAKDQIEAAVREQVRGIIDRIRKERLADLRSMAAGIVEEFRLRLERQITQLESSINRAKHQRPDPGAIEALTILAKRLEGLLGGPESSPVMVH